MTGANDDSGVGVQRRAAGISQQKLAALADCSVSMIRLLEAGYCPSSSRVLKRIAAVLPPPSNGKDPADEPGLATASAGQGRHGTE